MKKTVSLILALLLTLSLVCVFVACDGTPDNVGGGDLKGTIVVWWPGGSPTTEAAIQKAKQQYEAQHEGVTIDIRFQSTSDFYTSYNLALMGKDFPDVAYVDHVYVQRLAFDGSIANLSDYGADEQKDKFIDSLWKTTQYEGKTYALPMSANVLTLAYNEALLTRVLGHKLTDADMPTDWDSYMALGKKIADYNAAHNLTGNDKLYLTTVPAGTKATSMGPMFFMAYSAREGGSLMSNDLKSMTMNSAENKRAADKIKQLADLGYTPSDFSESGFENGKIAFIEMGPWKLTDYSRISADKAECDIKYAPIFPFAKGGSSQGALGLYSLVVSKKSTKAALAADFIKFVTTSDEIQLAHNSVQNLMPATKTAIADEFYKTAEWTVFVNQLNNVVARPGSAAWPAIEKTLGEYVTNIVTKSANGTSSYLDAIQIRLEEALEDLEDE